MTLEKKPDLSLHFVYKENYLAGKIRLFISFHARKMILEKKSESSEKLKFVQPSAFRAFGLLLNNSAFSALSKVRPSDLIHSGAH